MILHVATHIGRGEQSQKLLGIEGNAEGGSGAGEQSWQGFADGRIAGGTSTDGAAARLLVGRARRASVSIDTKTLADAITLIQRHLPAWAAR